jgi:hypothetical protein
MHDENTPAVPRPLDVTERDVLYLLTRPEDGQPIWSLDDIGRDIESADDADVATRGLHQAGLIHRTSDGFVFATRAAVRMVQMVGHVG